MKHLLVAVCAATLLASTSSPAWAVAFSDPRAGANAALDASGATEPRDPACRATTLVSGGGAFPRNPHTLAVRWTGFSNFELVYNGRVILLDAYYDRGSAFPPLGVKAADLKKADVILIGHGHYDHMADAASIAAQTNATVVGAPVTIEKLSETIQPGQLRTVTGRGGELLQFDGFTVEPILARHGEPDPRVAGVIGPAIDSLLPPMTAEQRAHVTTLRARATGGPRVITEGTIAYLITLDTGFRIMYRDSPGVLTDFEKAAMARAGGVDLAITAWVPSFDFNVGIKRAMDFMQIYRPNVMMPAHHDAGFTAGHDGLWRSTEPVFQALKDENPALITVSAGYREPVCFNTDFNISRQP